MSGFPLDAYLERIRWAGPVRPDRATLVGIHRAHLLAIPYENLEIQLGRGNPLDEAAFADKLVHRGRGGWCYEMNGTLTAALREIGFAVTRVGGAVARDVLGDMSIGNHMVGLVDLDGQRLVVDVGLGDGPLEPFPLEAREWREEACDFRLERLDDGWWRFHNQRHGLAPRFDFTEEPRDLDWYGPVCTTLQTEDFSPFVQWALTLRRRPDGFVAMRDTTHLHVRDGELVETVVADAADYRTRLQEILGCDLGDEVETLWRKVEARARARAAEAG